LRILTVTTPVGFATHTLPGMRPECDLSAQRAGPGRRRSPASEAAPWPPAAPVEAEPPGATGGLDLKIVPALRAVLAPRDAGARVPPLTPDRSPEPFPTMCGISQSAFEVGVLVLPTVERRRVHAHLSRGRLEGQAALDQTDQRLAHVGTVLRGPAGTPVAHRSFRRSRSRCASILRRYSAKNAEYSRSAVSCSCRRRR
jgi:hypothetical protein